MGVRSERRTNRISDVLDGAFADLAANAPSAFRGTTWATSGPAGTPVRIAE
ncbi:MAG TPA: hypothetical protein VGH43_14260 [Jatrophihabitans sp.]